MKRSPIICYSASSVGKIEPQHPYISKIGDYIYFFELCCLVFLYTLNLHMLRGLCCLTNSYIHTYTENVVPYQTIAIIYRSAIWTKSSANCTWYPQYLLYLGGTNVFLIAFPRTIQGPSTSIYDRGLYQLIFGGSNVMGRKSAMKFHKIIVGSKVTVWARQGQW
jgi:hypothetical protein